MIYLVYNSRTIQIKSIANYCRENHQSRGLIYMMRSFLFSLFLIHQAIAKDSSLMNFQTQGDILDSSGVVLPDDLLAETPSNQLSTPASTSEKINYSEPGQQTLVEGPELPLFAGSSIANCDSRIENSQDQTSTPYGSRQSLVRFNKRRLSDFCIFQPTDAPQKLEEGTSDSSTPSPEVPGLGIPGKSNSAPQVGSSKGPVSNEEYRTLIYSLPGTNGEPNNAACSILLKPLHKVPICAPPNRKRDSFADTVSPSRLCEFLLPKCPSPPLRLTSHIEGTDTFLLPQLQISLSAISLQD